MPAYIKDTGGTWSSAISAFYIKSTTWRTISAGYIKVAGAWASFFTSTLTPSIASTVEISRNNATYPSTLTGTNYYWTNSTSLTYVFQKSSDNVNFTDIGSAAVINNPSSGSSNTVTYALTLPDFPAFTSYYRFAVTAVNSTYSTSATSTSTSVSVSRPAPINTVAPTISPSSGTVGVTQYSVTSDGTWDPVDADGVYEYLWQSYDTPSYISAPGTNTLSTYTPPSDFLTLGYQSPIRCRVTAANASGSTSAFSSNTATVLGAALTPTFGANTSTAGGFTGSVTNYNAAYTWGISTNSGSVSFGTPSGSTYPFTVTGLSSSASATVTVTTSRSGYNSGSAQTTGTANAAPSPPTINSFSVTTTSITLNFSLGANSTSTRAYINGSFDGSTAGTSYTFSGLSANTTYTLALFGYNGVVQSTTSSGGSYTTNKNPALTPTFGSNTSITGGFTGSVTNYNASYTWNTPFVGAGTLSAGTFTWGSIIGSTRTFTVSGLSAGTSSTVTVTTTRTNYFDGSAQTTGTASSNVAPSGGSVSIALTTGTSGRVGAVYTATVTNASGTPTPTFTRQWKRSANYSPFTVTNVGTDSATYTSTYDDVDCAINCVVTFTNAAGSQTATSNSLLVSPPTITSITAVTTNNTAPYVTWTINGYNIQSSQGTVIYGSTTPPSIISGTDPQANAGLTRATSSRSGSTANYYRFNNVRAFSGLSQTGRFSPSVSAIATTTIVRANAAATITVYS
jgi:hypothetical protein